MPLGITDFQIADDAGIQTSKLEHRGLDLAYARTPRRKIYYVDSAAALASNQPYMGRTEAHPWATLAYAVTQAAQDSLIIVCERHAETISTATAWVWANKGVTIAGRGTGPNNMPAITMGTLATAYIILNKTDLTFDFIKFICNVDGLVAMIDAGASANGATIRNCFFDMDQNSTQVLTGINVAAANVTIENCEFECRSVGANSAILLGAAKDNVRILRNRITGDFADAGIQNPTGTVLTNLHIEGNSVTNTQAGDHAIQLVSACTGDIVGNRLWADTAGIVLLRGACKAYGNSQPDICGARRMVTRPTAALPQTTTAAIFTISGGSILIKQIVGEVTTVIQTQANNTNLVYNPAGTGSDVNLCAALDITADAVGTVYTIVGVTATAMKSTSLWTAVPADLIPAGGVLALPGTIDLVCAASNTGSVKWTLVYEVVEGDPDVVAN